MKCTRLNLLMNYVNCNQLIRNANIPSCKSCVHFRPDTFNIDFTSTLSKCNNFGYKNIITDEITYDYADSCRNDETKCGKEGRYFEEEENLNFKIVKHSIISISPYFLPALLLFAFNTLLAIFKK